MGVICLFMHARFGGPADMLDGFASVPDDLVEATRLVVGVLLLGADSVRQVRFGTATRPLQDVVDAAADALDAGLDAAASGFRRAVYVLGDTLGKGWTGGQRASKRCNRK